MSDARLMGRIPGDKEAFTARTAFACRPRLWPCWGYQAIARRKPRSLSAPRRPSRPPGVSSRPAQHNLIVARLVTGEEGLFGSNDAEVEP